MLSAQQSANEQPSGPPSKQKSQKKVLKLGRAVALALFALYQFNICYVHVLDTVCSTNRTGMCDSVSVRASLFCVIKNDRNS